MITIATSIMDKRIEAQQEAINSWLKLGFNVVSLNCPGEVEQLHAEFPGVRFVIIATPSSNHSKLPHVTISHILTFLASLPDRICGIVNSDILFRTGDDFLQFIENNAAAGMVFGSRIDLDNDISETKREFCLGFDYFFFDKKLISLFPHSDFCLGMPYWDYFMPMVLLACDVTVQRLISPVAYHRKHVTAWEQDLESFGQKYLEIMRSLYNSESDVSAPSARFLLALEDGNVGNCAEATLFMLRYCVNSLTYQPGVEDRAKVVMNIAAFEDMKAKLSQYDQVMAANQKMLAAIYSSTSWKITRPLRILSFMSEKIR